MWTHGKDGAMFSYGKVPPECMWDRKGGGKIEWKSPGVNTRILSRGQNKLIGEFKMAEGDVISIRG